MNNRAQIAMLGLEKHRQTLNAFIESIGPDVAREHDDDAFIIPLPYDLQLHLWAEVNTIQVRGKTCGGSLIQPTSPPVLGLPLMERCCSIIADYLSQTAGVELERFPAWCRDGVARELAKRAEALASLAGTSRTLSLGDALAAVEDELQRRGKVAPERVVERLLEAGMPCQWVEERPPRQWSYAGGNPDLRALQDAILGAGALPYIHVDYGWSEGGEWRDSREPRLYLGWEVIICTDTYTLSSLYDFAINPGPTTFDVLMGSLASTDPAAIVGAGPVAAWCRSRARK